MRYNYASCLRATSTTEVILLGTLHGLQDRLMRCAGPEIINSSAFDLIIANKKCIQHGLWSKMLSASGQAELAGEFLFFRQEWEEPNRIKAGNIQTIAKRYVGKRLVVLCGAEHPYILRGTLDKAAGITLKEFYDLNESNTGHKEGEPDAAPNSRPLIPP
jgi:hypothetical protein